MYVCVRACVCVFVLYVWIYACIAVVPLIILVVNTPPPPCLSSLTEGDETGVMDSLMEALQSGAAFRDRRKRTPRNGKPRPNPSPGRSRGHTPPPSVHGGEES